MDGAVNTIHLKERRNTFSKEKVRMLSIILPTYNEAQNIKKTISSLVNVLDEAKVPFEILVADDNSPDGTKNIVEKLSAKDKRIRLLVRYADKGLSKAIVDGFEHAKGNFFLVMDADGQHDETIIPRMFAEKEMYDIVVGSRYVKGGGFGSAPLYRLFVSRIASYLAFPLLGRKKIQDPMSGFFMVKKSLYEKVKKKINASGYKILLELLFAADDKVRIKEVPFHFKKREQGESKLGTKVILEYLLVLFKQGIKQHSTLLKFLFVGALGTIVNLGLMFFFVETQHFSYLLSSVLAVEVSILHNFFWNNHWTFAQRRTGKTLFVRLLRFNGVSLCSLLVNVGVFLLFLKLGTWYLLAQFFGIILAFFVNYLVNNYWVFKNE